MKLMQFLMGLDDTYMQLRINILSRDPLADAKGAYVLISSEESHTAIVIGLGCPVQCSRENLLTNLHPQGSKGSASENEMVATSEPDTALSKGGYPDTSTTEHGVN
ncbi:hypothetical protein Tco_0340731 [Tanacetum coccineum]